MTADFIGAGWNFPLGVDATSRVGLARQARDIEQAIEIILRTAPGERPMRPEFGCRIQDHLFSPTNAATAAAIADDVRAALDMWEPRIDVEDVRVGFDGIESGTFYIDILYRIRGDNDERNLVFPFYVIPDEPESVFGRRPIRRCPRRTEPDDAARHRISTTGRFRVLSMTPADSCTGAARSGPSTTSPTLGSR